MRKKLLMTTLLSAYFLNASGDNPLVTHIYTADPTARVFNDRLYIYPSHDIQEHDGISGANGFMMGDYHVFSTTDLINYTDHGVILDQKDVDWVPNDSYAMWAPDCNTRAGKYYFYFPGNFNIGVAVADDPAGPFIPRQTPIAHTGGQIDPNCFIDDDGTPYLYMGGGDNLLGMRMKSDMITPDMNPVTIKSLESQYKEGSFMFKRDGIYYFTYPVNLHGTEEICYATGNNPLGPFTQRGTIMDGWNDCWTNHHSIVEFKGQWYIFYHHEDLSGDQTLRSMCADKLFFNADGTIKKVTPTLRGIGIKKAQEPIQVDRYSDKSNVGIAVLKDNEPAGFKTESIKNNGWIKYNDVDFESADYSKVFARVASVSEGGQIEVRLGSSTGQLLSTIDVPSTGGLSNWTTVSGHIAEQPSGIEDLVCVFKTSDNNSYVLNWITFAPTNTILVSKSGTGNGIIKLNGETILDIDQMAAVIPYSSSETYTFTTESITDNEFVEWNQNGAFVNATSDVDDGDEIIAVFDYIQPARNATSKIEAEEYDEQSGVKSETCSEGGQNIGYIQNGDYVKFNAIDFQSGVDSINLRVASETDGARINVYLDSKSGTPVTTIAVPATGGFQTWSTISKDINVIDGIHDLYLEFVGGNGYLFNLNWIQFSGSPNNEKPVDSIIEAEAFSRMSGIQTEPCSEGGKNVGYIDTGDWLEYTITIPSNGDYTADLRLATLPGTGEVKIQIDGTTLATVDVPDTGGWQNWETATSSGFTLSAGIHTIRLKASEGGFNIDWLLIKPIEAAAKPVNIEAENYDNMSGVQTEPCYEGGQNIGYIDTGDWMEYSLSIPADGNYVADLRLATLPGTGTIKIKVDGKTQTTVNVPDTGGWQNWQTATSNAFAIKAGTHTMRLKATEGGFNIDRFSIKPAK